MIKFGTDGWRAVIAEEFTFGNVKKVAWAFSKFLKQKFSSPEIVVGYDRRFLSDRFAQTVARVMATDGVKVIFSESPCPTPAVSFFIEKEKLSGGAVITASHNPYEFNGFKVREWFGGPALPETTAELEKIIGSVQNEKVDIPASDFEELVRERKIEVEDITTAYLESIRRDANVEKVRRKMPEIVFDNMHGVCAGLPSRLFGKKAVEIRVEHNPLFPPYLKPEPMPSTLDPLVRACRKNRSDGFAFDGDGDRIFACTKSGKLVDPHKILALIVEHLVKNRKMSGKVFKTFSVSDIVDKVAQEYSLEVVTTPIGFKHITRSMIEGGVLVGGEESGGIGVSFHLKERDALFCSALLVEYMVVEGKDLGQLVSSLERRFGKHRYLRRDFHIPDELKIKSLDIAKSISKIAGMKVEKIETIDGVKLRFKGGGFLLVRPSGTEPVLRIYAETDSDEKCAKLIDEFCKIAGIKRK